MGRGQVEGAWRAMYGKAQSSLECGNRVKGGGLWRSVHTPGAPASHLGQNVTWTCALSVWLCLKKGAGQGEDAHVPTCPTGRKAQEVEPDEQGTVCSFPGSV